MSATPTPSVSSGQTRYYDALVMQFPVHSDDAAEKGPGNSSADPCQGAGSSGHALAHSLHRPPLAASRDQNDGANESSLGEGTHSPSTHVDVETEQGTPSLHSLPVEPGNQEDQIVGVRAIVGFSNNLERKESVRTTKSTHTTATTSFANGAPLTGPNAEPDVDESLVVRGARAERSLSQKQKDRIAKQERKESKKFSKLLKTESTTEKVALDSALENLSALQGLHKAAIKRETKAGASHTRALSAAQKAQSRFHEEKARTTEQCARVEARCAEERARWEGKEMEVRAQQERLDSARQAVRETEERIAECAREVERLRTVKATDEREREAKIIVLVGQK